MSLPKYAQAVKAILANKRFILIAKLLAILILIYFLFVKIDLAKVKTLLLSSDKLWLTAAFLMCVLSFVAASWRFQSFLRNVGIYATFWYNLKLYMLGMFYNIFLPGGIGGDGVKVYILQKRYNSTTKTVLLATLFDRLCGLWAISILGLLLLIMIPQANIPQQYPILLMFIGTAVYRLIAVKYFKTYSGNFIATHLKGLLVQGLQLICVCFILLSLDFQGKFSPFLLSYLLAGVVGIINLGFGGFGVRDLAMAHSADLFAIDSDTGVFITMASWLLQVIASLPGIYYTYRVEELSAGPEGSERGEISGLISPNP